MSAAQRDERIDLLRFIGLMMVMLAHVYPPAWVAQLRNFDVPLMVLVSALSFGASYKAESYGSYIWARVKRLVFPVWLFVTLLFLLEWLTGFPQQLPSADKIIRTYQLLDGIGYVWVIRVFLLVALVAPFLWRFAQQHGATARYWWILLAAYLGYELAVYLVLPQASPEIKWLLRDWLFYLWPYALVFAVGLKIPTLDSAQLRRFTFGVALVFAAFAVYFAMQHGQWYPTQKFKYPPQHYYLAYALLVGLLLWQLSGVILQLCRQLRLIRFVLFAGANSIWIYLWHIFAVQWWHPLSWGYEYLLICTIACALTWLQVRLVHSYLLPRVKLPQHKKNLRALLTG